MRRVIIFFIILIPILLLFRFYTQYKAIAAPIPPGVHLAGLDLSMIKDQDEIRRHLESTYQAPIAINYAGERLWLEPAEVDFQLDVEQMVWEASQYLEGTDFIEIAAREALGITQRRRDIQPRFTLNTDKLRTWLTNAAAQYDSEPQPARIILPIDRWSNGTGNEQGASIGYVGSFARNWRWSSGSPGYQIDIEASIPLLAKALMTIESQSERTVQLSVIETPSPPPTLTTLVKALDQATSNFPGFAAIYVQDLITGEEAFVDADVAFSGMSTLKIAIVTAVMQRLDGLKANDQTSYEIGQWIDFALGESNNYAANLLVRWLGNGDIINGARNFTTLMRDLDFVSTYMQSGYDAQTQLAQIPTPGNQQEDWNINPDSNLQSTPMEMGRILAAIYHCTQGEGLLLERFPQGFTPEECQHILFYLGHNQFQELTWAGLPRPNDAWILHKHGFTFESHSDVALIWGPAGPYILSVFLYRAGWMDWDTSNDTMKDVSRITWNFFEHLAKETDHEAGSPLELLPPPGYVPVNEYVPAAGG